MIPACPHPLALAGDADPLDEYGKVARALRTRAAASASLDKTFGASGNRKTWTWAGLVKRGKNGVESPLFGAHTTGGYGITQKSTYLRFASADALVFTIYYSADGVNTNYSYSVVTNRLFRDDGAWHFVVVAVDTTQATAAARVRLYFDGVEITSFSSASYPPQNHDTFVTEAGVPHWHNRSGFNPNFYYGDQYFAGCAFIDGKALTPAAFGQFHPVTGQWRPKSKAAIRAAVAAGGGARNGWGANGFFLPFDDPTSLTTLGYDRSQSDTDTTGNNWTATNVSLTAGATYDSMLDTPTANYCTLNPLIGYTTAPTFSDGNLTFLGGVAASPTVFGTMGMTTGVWWWEVKPNSSNTPIGIAKAGATPNNYLGSDANGWAYNQSGQKFSNGSAVAYGAAYTSADTVGVLFDASAGTLEFFKQTNSTGAFVSQGVAYSGLTSGPYFPAASDGATGTAEGCTFNFGQRPLNNASLPAGAKTLNTKNLKYPAIPKSTSAFVAVSDSGANIQTTLAAARAGWASYIEIFRSRSAEGWRWRFSDDLANYLDTSTTNAKAAFPALGGASYFAYALKVSAANGVATGTFAHVNGAADTITDNLGNSRKAVILKCESAGGWNFFFYHPDLTAGKLLYLNTTAIETTDASIGSVTANSFVAAAALPTGTYRWIALAETADFLKLFKHTGNGSTDGAFDMLGFTPAFLHTKRIDAVGNHYIQDAARSPYNPTNAMTALEQATAESAGSAVDLVSNGAKLRNTDSSQNASGGVYVGIGIAAFPFRYANAR